MKNVLPLVALAVVGLLTACGGDAESTENRVSEGPMSFEVPEGWEQVTVEGDVSQHAWTLGYSDDLDETTKSLRVMPNVDATADPSVAVNTLITVCRFTNVYADDCRGTGQETVDIDGAEEGIGADFTYTSETDEQVTGRIWVAVDTENDVVSAVEYAGIGIDEDELEAFGETIEFDPDNAE